MLRKLRLVLKGPKGLILPLALKAAVFSALLLLVNSHWLLVILFILTALYFYFRSSLNVGQFFLSFLVLLSASLLAITIVNSQWSIVIVVFFGFFFFLLLGVKNLIFVNRQPFYYLFNSLLLLIIFIFFFWSENFQLFFIRYLLVFFAMIFLSKEFLTFSIPGLLNSSKKNLIIYGTAFLVLQLLWAITLLPISFLNAAALALLIILILQDFITHHFSGTMSRQIVLRNITVFLILSLVIFGASRWTP